MGKTVPVVDDAGVVRQMNALTLKKDGFEVFEAVDGKEALSKIREEVRPDRDGHQHA